MQIDEQEIATTYRGYSDDELADLAAEPESLTEVARAALVAETQRRGLGSAQLEKMHSGEMHRQARFDEVTAMRRKKTALYLLTKNDPKGLIAFALILLGLGVFAWLRSFYH